jgi:hypothetical protein
MIIPDAWRDDEPDLELINLQQQLCDIGALLIAFQKTGDERLLFMAMRMTGEYDE